MKIINVEQGSPEWLSWRKTVITATDCPAILGSSPWSTAYKCWQRKLDLIEEQPTNYAMERGKGLEPFIRERFIEKFGINMTPAVVESSEYDFLGASLDGISDCGKYILEIKTGGLKLYGMGRQGMIPQYYLDQIQHQLLVTGADKAFYHLGGEDEEKDIVIEVLPDPAFKAKFLPVAKAFLKCMAFSEPPELQDSDYVDMSKEPAWNEAAKEYRQLSIQIKMLEEIKEQYRKELLKRCADQNCSGGGVKIMKMVRRGRIVYDEIPELKDVDLDKYREEASSSWKILTT
jgi:putative phage-type endonuclease